MPDRRRRVAASLSNPAFRLGGAVIRGEADVGPGAPFSPVGEIPRSPVSWGGLWSLRLVGYVSRGAGRWSWSSHAGRSSSMICRTCMGGGIVWLLFRTPGGNNILLLFSVREGVSGLSQARAMEDLLCLGPRPLLGGWFAGERRSAAVIRRKGSFGSTGFVSRRPFPRGYTLVRGFVERCRKGRVLFY